MRVPSEADLADGITEATRAAVADLFRRHPNHRFYYCTLITTGEALAPSLCAWSEEALSELAGTDSSALRDLRWSYADSPFYCYGEHHYEQVRQMFEARPALDPSDPPAWESEFQLRLRAMEQAMSRLDQEGLFGSGPSRLAIVVNVEVMPPDHTNVERALRLNPRYALGEWLESAAERQ